MFENCNLLKLMSILQDIVHHDGKLLVDCKQKYEYDKTIDKLEKDNEV